MVPAGTAGLETKGAFMIAKTFTAPVVALALAAGASATAIRAYAAEAACQLGRTGDQDRAGSPGEPVSEDFGPSLRVARRGLPYSMSTRSSPPSWCPTLKAKKDAADKGAVARLALKSAEDGCWSRQSAPRACPEQADQANTSRQHSAGQQQSTTQDPATGEKRLAAATKN